MFAALHLDYRRHLQIPAVCVCQLHMPWRSALRLKYSGRAHENAYAFYPGRCHVEPIRAVKKFHTARSVGRQGAKGCSLDPPFAVEALWAYLAGRCGGSAAKVGGGPRPAVDCRARRALAVTQFSRARPSTILPLSPALAGFGRWQNC